jgi:hypothetical protein
MNWNTHSGLLDLGGRRSSCSLSIVLVGNQIAEYARGDPTGWLAMAYDHIRQFWDGLGERASGLA